MSSSHEPGLEPPAGERGHRSGPDRAPVTLVEFGDFQCEDSGAAYPILKRIRSEMGDLLLFVFRHFPLNHEHAYAQAAAEAAESAGSQGRFWEMHDALYENQDDVRTGNILAIASIAGVDIDTVQADLESRRFRARVDDDHASGVKSGVSGTPTFFVDGQRVDIGEDYESLLGILQRRADAAE